MVALFRHLPPLAAGRFRFPLLSVALLAVLVFLAVACKETGGEKSAVTPGASPDEQGTHASTVVTVYSSPTCGCCHQYERYLEEKGFELESIRTENLDEIKDDLGIPQDMQACHTATIEEYFVEGHVPVEAIWKLLEEQPPIDGIALPGMPSGAPGMGGDKTEPFVIYSIVDGRSQEFMTL